MSKICLGLDHERCTHDTETEISKPPPGPCSVDILRLGIVQQCAKLVQRDIGNYESICLRALEIIGRLARVIKDEDQVTFRKHLRDARVAEICRWVRHIFLSCLSPQSDDLQGPSSPGFHPSTFCYRLSLCHSGSRSNRKS